MPAAKVIPLLAVRTVARAVPAQQLVPAPVLSLLHNAVGAEPVRAMVSAALKSWMAGDPLSPREQRIVEVVLDTNYATQIGRLCLPNC